MKQGKYVLSIVLILMLSLGLSSCYVGTYGPRRGYYNRGPHYHYYPHHYPRHYHGGW